MYHNPGLTNGASLRKLRKELGKTQKWFAEKAGYTRVHISNIERGNQLITQEKLDHLTNILLDKPSHVFDKESVLMVKEITKQAIENKDKPQTFRFYKVWYDGCVLYLVHQNHVILEYDVKERQVIGTRAAHTEIHANAINMALDALNHNEYERALFQDYRVLVRNRIWDLRK